MNRTIHEHRASTSQPRHLASALCTLRVHMLPRIPRQRQRSSDITIDCLSQASEPVRLLQIPLLPRTLACPLHTTSLKRVQLRLRGLDLRYDHLRKHTTLRNQLRKLQRIIIRPICLSNQVSWCPHSSQPHLARDPRLSNPPKLRN